MNEIIGIALAVCCALATNVGFLYKHRGANAAPPVDIRRPVWTAGRLFSQRAFAIGMGIAVFAWLFHVGALAMVPMSIVQAVLAGGIVLMAVMAERVLGVTVRRKQWIGIGMTALGLVLLAITLPAAHGANSRYSVPAMVAFEATLLVAGTLLIMGPRWGAPVRHHGVMLGGAAGLLFGVSDVSIKALSGTIGAHGLLGLASPWLIVTLVASFVAFYASAKAFQEGEPVPVIAVTSTAANVTGILGGIVVFGDPISSDPVGIACQVLAFALVIAAAWMTPAPTRAAGLVAQ